MKQPAPLFNATQTIITLLLWLLCYVAHGQAPSKDLQPYMPQPFIDKIELVVGPSLQFPNDHGYGDALYIGSGKATTDVYSPKLCYIAGIGLIHSLNRRLELSGRILWERKGYLEEQRGGLPFKDIRTTYNLKNSYLSGLFAPRIYIGTGHSLYLFGGVFYSYLLSAVSEEKFYIDGQLNETRIFNDTEISKYEWGVSGGIGYSINLRGKNAIVLQLHGSHGLSDIVRVNNLRVTSQSLALSVAYQIDRKIQLGSINKK
jgi:hypothetical protein